MLEMARRLRHGPLRKWSPFWTFLGRIYGRLLTVNGAGSGVSMNIGPYGPFKFDPHFAFSNFANFGHGKNGGLSPCVDASTGANCVFDIGAHIGLVSLPVCRVLAPSGRLFAFEPGDDNRNFLLKHLKLNGFANVEVLGLVVSDENIDEVEFFEQPGDSDMNSLASMSKAGSFSPVVKRQTNLDSFCSANDLSPDVMKIDVEGAEIRVLHGARETIKRHKPIIFLSAHRKQIAELGGSLDELLTLIHDMDYEVFDFDNNVVQELSTSEFLLTPRPAD